jgi:hypothetical protein
MVGHPQSSTSIHDLERDPVLQVCVKSVGMDSAKMLKTLLGRVDPDRRRSNPTYTKCTSAYSHMRASRITTWQARENYTETDAAVFRQQTY